MFSWAKAQNIISEISLGLKAGAMKDYKMGALALKKFLAINEFKWNYILTPQI